MCDGEWLYNKQRLSVPRIVCLALKESHGEAALTPSWSPGALWELVFRASASGSSAFSEASALEAQRARIKTGLFDCGVSGLSAVMGLFTSYLILSSGCFCLMSCLIFVPGLCYLAQPYTFLCTYQG